MSSSKLSTCTEHYQLFRIKYFPVNFPALTLNNQEHSASITLGLLKKFLNLFTKTSSIKSFKFNTEQH